jgi:hypothetical protein
MLDVLLNLEIDQSLWDATESCFILIYWIFTELDVSSRTMSKKIKYLVANLVAPGIGHFAMKKWIRGVIYFFGAAACIIWLIIALAIKIKSLYYSNMDTPDSAFSGQGMLIALLPAGALFLLWFFSYIDLCLFCKIPIKTDK